MQIEYTEFESNLRMVKLNGRLDIMGVGEIENRFAGYFSGDNIGGLIDFSDVTFLASIGIRMLVVTAKSLANRGGKMVLVNPRPEVQQILDVTGIPAIIPVFPDQEAARLHLLSDSSV